MKFKIILFIIYLLINKIYYKQLAFSNSFVGSTRGFDEIFENKVSCVNESKLYCEENINKCNLIIKFQLYLKNY